MVVTDAIVQKTEAKGKSCSQETMTQKSNPDCVSFADIIGKVTQQIPETDEGRHQDISFCSMGIDNEDDPKIKSDTALSGCQTEISAAINDIMLMANCGLDINSYSNLNPFWDESSHPKDMNLENLTMDVLSNRGNAQMANPAIETDDLALGKLKMETMPMSGNDTLAMKKERGYSQTWQMNMGLTEHSQFAEKPQQDPVSRLMRELGGQMELKNEISTRSGIVVTEKNIIKTLSLNVVSEPSKGDIGSMDMMMAKNFEIISSPITGSSQIPAPSALAPQVIQAIQQGAMHLQPQEIKEMTLKLHPQELGKLDLFMRVEDGRISVTIKASEMGTGQLLQNQMQDLKQSLRDAGLDANVEMDFGHQGHQQQSFKEAFQKGYQEFGDRRQFTEGLSPENHRNENIDNENLHAENRNNRGILCESAELQDTINFQV